LVTATRLGQIGRDLDHHALSRAMVRPGAMPSRSMSGRSAGSKARGMVVDPADHPSPTVMRLVVTIGIAVATTAGVVLGWASARQPAAAPDPGVAGFADGVAEL